MEDNHRSKDWRSILLLIFNLLGIALITTGALSTFFLLFLNKSNLDGLKNSNASPLAVMLSGNALILIAVLLVPATWLSFQKLRGKEIKSLTLAKMSPWVSIISLGLWLLATTLAAVLHDKKGASLYIPMLHALSVTLPVYIIGRVAIKHIPLGSSQRAWGVFNSGMILSPLLATIIEISILLVVVIIFGFFFGLDANKVFELQRLATQIENAPNKDNLEFLLRPYLNNPTILIVALMFLAAIVPVVEELVKSIGVWFVFNRITSLAQGFAMGVLSGAGFAIVESLFSSITPDSNWALTLSARAISGGMHMLASGLVGLGIAYVCLEKKYSKAITMMGLGILLHGLWNAGAILVTAGELRIMLTESDPDTIGNIMVLGGIGLLVILITVLCVAVIMLNKRLRTITTHIGGN